MDIRPLKSLNPKIDTSDSDSTIVNKYLGRFDAYEIDVLRKIFNSLSSKHPPHNMIDKVTFLQFFSLPGLWGERLYKFFAFKHSHHTKQPVIDYAEFLVGIAECCRSPMVDKIRVLFRLFDLDSDGVLSFDEIMSIFQNIPRVEKYLLTWEDVQINARIVDIATETEVNRVHESNKKETNLLVRMNSGTSQSSSPIRVHSGIRDDNKLMMDSDDDENFVDVEIDSIHPPPERMNNNPIEPSMNQTALINQFHQSDNVLIPPPSSEQVTVADIVDNIFRKFGGSTRDGVTFVEFKTWIEKSGGLMFMFNRAMHEEFWGLRGNALFRDVNQSAYFIRNLRALKEKERRICRPCMGRKHVSIIEPQPMDPPYMRRTLSGNVPSIVAVGNEAGDDVSTITQNPSINSMLTFTKLVDEFTLSDPSLHVITGNATVDKCLLACPDCEKPLLYCPRCKKPGTSLKVLEPGRKLVINCKCCINGESIAFDKCWLCDWSFSKANHSNNPTNSRSRGRFEGYMEKIGRTLRQWTSRYYVLTDSMLYYYESAEDLKPSGVIFLEGCFVKKLSTEASRVQDENIINQLQRGRKKKTQLTGGNKDVDPVADSPATRKGLRAADKWGLVITQKAGHKKTVREFYLPTMELRDAWISHLCFGTGQRKVDQVYQFGEKIGQGKFSTVYRATHSVTGHKVAIKVIKKTEVTSTERDVLRTELRVISILDHPSIIKLIDIFDEQYTVCIVMELVEGGELFDHFAKTISENEGVGLGKGLPEVEVQHVMKELLDVVAYLSSCGIAHRDLKPENILLTPVDQNDRYHIKLADFGLSSICGPEGHMTQPCGTLPYVAPEVIGQRVYGKGCDMWACGVIMYLLLRGRLPFPTGKGLNNQLTYRLKMDDPVWRGISQSAQDIIIKMLNVDPLTRLKPHEALQHVWIKNPSAAISVPRASLPPTHLALVPDTAWDIDGIGDSNKE